MIEEEAGGIKCLILRGSVQGNGAIRAESFTVMSTPVNPR